MVVEKITHWTANMNMLACQLINMPPSAVYTMGVCSGPFYLMKNHSDVNSTSEIREKRSLEELGMVFAGSE